MTRTVLALESDYRVKEPELIARVLAGDRRAARELYDAHAPRVFRLVHRLTGDEELSTELVQEAFIRTFAQLGRFRGESSLATWIHRIALSVVANGMRRVRRIRSREVDLIEASDVGTGRSVDPDLRDRLAQAIDGLPEIYRTTLIMHDMEGYTHTEIAEVLGVAEGTCKSRLSTARAQLRSALADFAGDIER